MLIALFLAVLTAIEVAISYIKGLGDAAQPAADRPGRHQVRHGRRVLHAPAVRQPVVRRLLRRPGSSWPDRLHRSCFFTLGGRSARHPRRPPVIARRHVRHAGSHPRASPPIRGVTSPTPRCGSSSPLAATAYWYALTRIGPRVVAKGETGRHQAGRCGASSAACRRAIVASVWPIHDWAEDYLFSVHMVEHLLISLVAPPLLLLGDPRLADPLGPAAPVGGGHRPGAGPAARGLRHVQRWSSRSATPRSGSTAPCTTTSGTSGPTCCCSPWRCSCGSRWSTRCRSSRG